MFKNKYVLKYHVEGAHNKTVGEPSPQLRRRLEKRSLNTVTCFCGISFETMNSYNEHMRTHQHAAAQVQNEVSSYESPMQNSEIFVSEVTCSVNQQENSCTRPDAHLI